MMWAIFGATVVGAVVVETIILAARVRDLGKRSDKFERRVTAVVSRAIGDLADELGFDRAETCREAERRLAGEGISCRITTGGFSDPLGVLRRRIRRDPHAVGGSARSSLRVVPLFRERFEKLAAETQEKIEEAKQDLCDHEYDICSKCGKKRR